MATTTPATPELDQGRLEEFIGRFAGDLGAAVHAATVSLGDKLGLYRSLAEGPATSPELATRSGCDERLVREWLRAQAASGYVMYDEEPERYWLSPEQAACLADEANPAFMVGAMQIVASLPRDEARLIEAYRTGTGFGWHEHDHDLFAGTERFFRAGYAANLVSSWIPALDGVEAKLTAGARVADVGCGHGASTILMAEAYPASGFIGFDYHEGSVDVAREAAARAGVEGRVEFQVAGAKDFPGAGFDVVAIFDALHDMGDPVGAAAHVCRSLSPDGTFLLVEPYATDRVEDNLNPVGRIYYSASSLICVPCSQSQEVGLALGAQAGEARLREVLGQAGFSRVRRATETPFNLVLEARR
ncbi:MAG: methyltransferase domain-containing protein [Actinomycetota bacterium]|nr:methyltransferase domain-containing protein [Actinomycetota bacterium]